MSNVPVLEILFSKSRVCTSGSWEGALSGFQYNHAWRIHDFISEALERLLFKRFKNEVANQMSDEVFNITCEDKDSGTEDKVKTFS